MAASRTIVVVSSSDDGLAGLPGEVPAGTAEDAVPPAPVVVAGATVDAGGVTLAAGGTVPPGSAELAGALADAVLGALDVAVTRGTIVVAVPGVVELARDLSAACAEEGSGAVAASAAQQIPAVTRRRRIRRHRLTKSRIRPRTPSLTAARR